MPHHLHPESVSSLSVCSRRGVCVVTWASIARYEAAAIIAQDKKAEGDAARFGLLTAIIEPGLLLSLNTGSF